MADSSFQPCYLFPNEYAQYGLPSGSDCSSDVGGLVLSASTLIDEACGRTDGEGNGSLVWTTYQERILSQSPGRNLMLLPFKPLAAVTPAQIATLENLDSVSGNHFYTGVLPSVNTLQDGRLSAVISASGRYAFSRRDGQPGYNDPYGYVNPLTVITLFGGPPPWETLDMTNIDYDPQTGEIWISAGIMLERFTEVVITYTSGFDPQRMPRNIKLATALLVKNLMTRPGGSTGLKSFNGGQGTASFTFDPDIIDPTIDRLLTPFKTLRTY